MHDQVYNGKLLAQALERPLEHLERTMALNTLKLLCGISRKLVPESTMPALKEPVSGPSTALLVAMVAVTLHMMYQKWYARLPVEFTTCRTGVRYNSAPGAANLQKYAHLLNCNSR